MTRKLIKTMKLQKRNLTRENLENKNIATNSKVKSKLYENFKVMLAVIKVNVFICCVTFNFFTVNQWEEKRKKKIVSRFYKDLEKEERDKLKSLKKGDLALQNDTTR